MVQMRPGPHQARSGYPICTRRGCAAVAPAVAKLTGLTHELAFDGARFCFESGFNAEAASTACRFSSTNFRKEHSAIMSKWNSTTWDQSKVDEQRDEIKAALRRFLKHFCGLFSYGSAVFSPACKAVAYIVLAYNAFAGVKKFIYRNVLKCSAGVHNMANTVIALFFWLAYEVIGLQ